MRITDVELLPIAGGWYFDDKAAIDSGGVVADHYLRTGRPKTPGFREVREPGSGVGVILHLAGAPAVYGDGTSVTYAGTAGRDPILRFEDLSSDLTGRLRDALVGREAVPFLPLAEELEGLTFEGRRMHSALRYAVSQALLEAEALAQGCTKAEALAGYFGLEVSNEPLRIGVQSGTDRYAAVDKAIYRRVDVFPHALIHDVSLDLGGNGETLLGFARWIKARLAEHQVEEDYRPSVHFDCYGTIGRAFGSDPGPMADYLMKLEDAVSPLGLQIESPVELDSQAGQIHALRGLKEALADRGSRVVLIADEWCNTLADVRKFAEAGAVDMVQVKMPDLGGITESAKAVLECKKNGVLAYLGGSCNETDLNARNAVHLAVATGADQVLARPGMGVDEGVAIMRNEETRLRALLRRRTMTEHQSYVTRVLIDRRRPHRVDAFAGECRDPALSLSNGGEAPAPALSKVPIHRGVRRRGGPTRRDSPSEESGVPSDRPVGGGGWETEAPVQSTGKI